jgi:hypothetical protein
LCAQTVADCYEQEKWVAARCGEFAALMFQFCVEAGLPPENLLMVETKDKHVLADHTFVLYSSSKFDLHDRGQEVVLPKDGKVWALDGWAKDKLKFLENRKELKEYCVETMKQVTMRASSPRYVRACGV